MREDFLHFIWQYQYFDRNDLVTKENENVNILRQGTHNTAAGPDFEGSKIRIGEIEWTGHAEIHIKSSMWNDHRHQHDSAYNGVILHIVWEDDKKIFRNDGSPIPTIELRNRIDPSLIDSYYNFFSKPDDIVCRDYLTEVNQLIKIGMIEKSLVTRLEKKAKGIQNLIDECDGDWDEVAYRLLASNFGFKVNNEPFRLLAMLLPLRVLQKNSDSLFKIEALLFGQAGFLAGKSEDSYHADLKSEFHFLRNKYKLQDTVLDVSVWKFGRLRPPNFPTVRISQLAALLHTNIRLFESLSGSVTVQSVRQQLNAKPSEYWNEHYRFGGKAERKTAGVGKSSTDVLIINTSVPLMAAYSLYSDDQGYMDRAIGYLHMIKPESNRIINQWKNAGIFAESSADSQGLIELFNSYCLKKSCLWCNIGTSILNRSIQPHG